MQIDSLNNTIKSVDDTQFNKFLYKIDTVLDKCERLEEMIKQSPRLVEALGNKNNGVQNPGLSLENHVKQNESLNGFKVQDYSVINKSRYNSREQAKKDF